MDGIGLVFSGGGGKGAYQIDVWKYLREQGLDKEITAISETSVGALNAVLFCTKKLKHAEDIWLNISRNPICNLAFRARIYGC